MSEHILALIEEVMDEIFIIFIGNDFFCEKGILDPNLYLKLFILLPIFPPSSHSQFVFFPVGL